jgi:hypothetical protein
MARAAHALAGDGRVWLIDPFDDPGALEAVAGLGEPAGVIQLLDRHNRDCAALAARLGVPHLRLPQAGSGTPFEVLGVISTVGWHEIALWWAERETLVVAEAVGTNPAFALGRRAGVHPMLRVLPPRRALTGVSPERLLCGHGRPLQSGGAEALQDAFDHARSDLPRLLLSLPRLLRG